MRVTLAPPRSHSLGGPRVHLGTPAPSLGRGLPIKVQVHTRVSGHTETGVSPGTAVLTMCEPVSPSWPVMGPKMAGGSLRPRGPSHFQTASNSLTGTAVHGTKAEYPACPSAFRALPDNYGPSPYVGSPPRQRTHGGHEPSTHPATSFPRSWILTTPQPCPW